MAILQGITSAVRSQIAGRLNSAVRSGIRGGVDSLSGTTREGANSALNSIPPKGKFTTEVFSYPEDVANDPQAGHFILFEINEFTQGKIVSPKVEKDFATIKREIDGSDELGSLPQAERTQIAIRQHAEQRTSANEAKSQGSTSKSIQAQKATKRVGTAISLYMPPSVTVEYSVGYKDDPIGTLAMLGRDAIQAFSSGGGTTAVLNDIVDSLASTGAEGLKGAGLKAVDVVAPGASSLVQLSTGKVVTPKMELMFENVGRRNFSFTFAFIPKSVQEAKSIEKIIYSFKENMMPEFVEGSQREMKIPNTFDIKYMYQNTENKFINKISSCFLKSMNVTYGGDRYTAYNPVDGSPVPQKSTITLSFGEIEVMHKDLIKRGY
tara:strand:- start:1968 stop:3104 length:1137 start_codon:yes stop_codon:yes gene_type:complete